MNRRDAIKGGLLSIFVGMPKAAHAIPMPEIRIATDLEKDRPWFVFKEWIGMDQTFLYELREAPDKSLQGVSEFIDRRVPEREILALKAHGYDLRMINPNATKEEARNQ